MGVKGTSDEGERPIGVVKDKVCMKMPQWNHYFNFWKLSVRTPQIYVQGGGGIYKEVIAEIT